MSDSGHCPTFERPRPWRSSSRRVDDRPSRVPQNRTIAEYDLKVGNRPIVLKNSFASQSLIVSRTADPSEPQSIHFQDPLHVRKEHFDLFALPPGLPVIGRSGDGAGYIAR